MTIKLRLALLGSALGAATVPSIASAADATATAGIQATVVKPIAITKTADLNFGSFAADDLTAGTVVISAAGARTFTNGTSAVSSGAGTVTAASFNVTGEGTSTFSIVLPGTVTLTNTTTGATGTMSVGTFVSNPSGTGTLSAGALTVGVGATLSVAAGQTVGVYSNGSGLPVTVAYN
jgi:hypothetical protein